MKAIGYTHCHPVEHPEALLDLDLPEPPAPQGRELHAVQRALLEENGFQCGFCTPGLALAIDDLLRRGVPLDDETLREELSGNLCRCTGYDSIVRAALRAAGLVAAEAEERP